MTLPQTRCIQNESGINLTTILEKPTRWPAGDDGLLVPTADSRQAGMTRRAIELYLKRVLNSSFWIGVALANTTQQRG
jgi:hypothetical protein